MVDKKKYIFSFTGASALISETMVIAEEFNRLKDWERCNKSYYLKIIRSTRSNSLLLKESFQK